MARLLADADLRGRFAAAATERVERFTASAVAERLEAVYARVAPRNSVPHAGTRQVSGGGRDADASLH